MFQDLLKKSLSRLIYLCFLIFGLLALLNESDSVDILWTIIFIPINISIFLMMPSFHIYISDNFTSQKSSSSVIVLILYCFLVSLLLFSIILSVKLDGFIESNWYSVFISFWFSIFSVSIFTVFMLPGMLDPSVKLYREAITLLCVNIGLIVTSLLLPAYLHGDINYVWIALIPLILIEAVCTVFYLRDAYLKNDFFWALIELEFMLYVFSAVFMVLWVIDDKNSAVPNYSFFIAVILASGLLLVSNEILGTREEKLSYEEVEKDIMIEENYSSR